MLAVAPDMNGVPTDARQDSGEKLSFATTGRRIGCLTTPLAGRFAAQVAHERKLLFDLTGAGPLQQVEADNEKAFNDLLQVLVADAGARFVAQELDKRHQDYWKTFDPRLKQITDRLEAIQRAIRKARRSLKEAAAKAPQLASALRTQRSELDEAQKQLRGAGKGVARHLNAILRRGKVERVVLDALHAVLFLALFTFGFEWVGESVCGWAARLVRVQELSRRDCAALWFVVTVALFAAERWFLGPLIDRWLEQRMSRSTLKALGFYYVERTRLEYRLAILEHETDTSYKTLQSVGLL